MLNSQVSGLAADLREAKQQLLQSQELMFHHKKACNDLELDLECTVQVSRSGQMFFTSGWEFFL